MRAFARLPARPRRSWLCPVLLAAALLATAPSCRPKAPNLYLSTGRTIVCLGDSITFGVGAEPGQGYPEKLSGLLGVPVINAGVSGDTAADGLARLDAVLAQDPWLVIVELGGNDFLRQVPLTETEASLRKIAGRLLKAKVVPVFVQLSGPLGLGRYAEVTKQVKKDFGVVLVEGALSDILFDPKLKSDQIHPNALGYEKLAEAVADEVKPLLAARGKR